MLSLKVIFQSGSVQTASDWSPNRIRLESKPQMDWRRLQIGRAFFHSSLPI